MGKASKWIRNLLLGKKEENLKQIDTFCSENKTTNTVNSSNSSSNKIVVKRRWSFRKLTSGRSTGKVVAHKISKSFDSVDSPKLQIQALMFQSQTPRTAAEFVRTAATRIQASFRSYLARRALHALRGLVKLQALVRGHLVRKQTTATLRGMHALMSIQVRARIKRIKMAEEVIPPEIPVSQHTESPCFEEYMTQPKQHQDSKNMNVEEMLEALRSRSGPIDVKSRKYDSMAYYSKSQSISKRENQLKNENHNNNNNNTTTIITAPNSPEKYYRDMIDYLNPRSSSISLSTSQRHMVPPRQSWSSPKNYMSKTESSKAKTRSSSEPRQRPTKQGTKQKSNNSIECSTTSSSSLKKNMLSNSARYDHWVVNSMKESKRDSF
ncbi:protein IQ-DOMAIN 19-like [Trifolium pratense]|uniref:protein IQ-DOMAIN 19-like n=1 Tax=Trifolium pratense TaxID=57577 RepID=UPI001E6908EC|nr:protein IQ-DOMAIN 19-like [Trifolium pratense]